MGTGRGIFDTQKAGMTRVFEEQTAGRDCLKFGGNLTTREVTPLHPRENLSYEMCVKHNAHKAEMAIA